uniref:Vitellogenin n=1 Tax=Saturnia japonica TaxID=37778 RepID=Q59IU3_9NEOP|nr:vitellogenin [Saturnia japonica]
MKLLVLAVVIAAVSSLHGDNNPEYNLSPWQVGKVYRYDVKSHTLARLEEGTNSGSAFKAYFIIRVKTPGRLQARLENPQHAQIHEQLPYERDLPYNLNYQPVQKLDNPFEISFEGGRINTLSLPSSMSLPHENLLKGLISTLQLDLSTHRNIQGSQNRYDQEQKQGLFRKMETDVTGDCETLYTVSPVASEWRRELPKFASEEDPIEITKSKNYGHCHHRVAYHFGMPEGAEWTGTAHNPEEDQFIRRAAVSRILVGKQGPIYKAETTSTVQVNPHLFGKQNAEVYSHVHIELESVEQDSQPEWETNENNRLIKNLLYSMSTKQIATHDSSSSSSSESYDHSYINEEPKQRLRHSMKVSKVGAVQYYINQQKKHRYDRSSSSSSSSSSSDSSSAYINDEMPSLNDPAYAALHMSPQTHTDKKQNSVNAQKLLQDMAQQLQNPNNMPKSDFLSKFNVLVRLIAAMTTEQLTQTSRTIEAAKSSNNNIKADMWMVYRDAVTQAGTLPAFQQIKNWINSKKIQGEEAAQVVASMPLTLRYPTKEVMIQFFKLARSPEVKDQLYLNTTALIAATKFINMGQVNNDTAHNFYPTHMYGRLARKYDNFVLEQILPPLAEELKNAIQSQDSVKAQVYVKSIGNLGHPEILRVFAPYLEGQIKVSTYLRVQIISNLYALTSQRNRQARAVLFSILRNTAEPYEVRVAAIHNIFNSHPTVAMMQAMAEMTYDDPSVHVRAALKSGIESAANLRSPHSWDLSRSAQMAKWMLQKENYGYQYSFKLFSDGYDMEDELEIFNSLSHIGSDDSLAPKYLKYSVKTKNTGWNKIQASVSSYKHFIEALEESMFYQQRSKSEHKYSSNKISELLNMKRVQRDSLEAFFYVNLANQQRYFTFSEEDLRQLPHDISEYFKKLEKGVEQHYTKTFNQAQVSVMFPVAMGVPFIYKYKEPTLIHIQGRAKGEFTRPSKEQPQYSAQIAKEVQFTYARNIDGDVGFMDTISNQHVSVGVVSKLQFNVPIKLDIQVKPKEFKIKAEPLHPEQDITVIHYSVWPYSTIHKKDSLLPISLDPNTKVIERQKKTLSFDNKFGQATGTIFHYQGYSYSTDYRNIGTIFKSPDFMTNVAAFVSQEDIALTHFNIRYLGKQSQNKAVTFTAVYDEYYNQKEGGEWGPAVEQEDLSPNSEARRQAMAKRVSAGINTANAKVVDFSATFEGSHKADYLLTAAVSQSPVDPKVQYAFFAGKNSAQHGKSQFNVVANAKFPKTNALNFLQVLDNDLKTTFEADIKFNHNGNIHLYAEAERSKKYTEELQKYPLAKQCVEDIARNNQYTDTCHKMIIKAHAPDHFKFTFNYKDISNGYKNYTYNAYMLAKYFGFWYAEVNPAKSLPEGKVEIELTASYLDRTFDASMMSKYGYVRMQNLPLLRSTPYALAIYQPFQPQERVANFYTSYQYQPYCSVDGSKIRTFSNRSYDYILTSSWHVVMYDEPQEHGIGHEVVILARKPKPNYQEVYISYKSETGKDFEVEIQPAPEGSKQPQVNVKTNSKKVSEGEFTIYWNDVEQKPFLEYYTQQDGVLMLNIEEYKLRAMYDGQRLIVLASANRQSARGICGSITGEPRDDYLTPEGLVDNPEYYAASYALYDEYSDPKTQELKTKAKQEAYQPKNKYTTVLRSDPEWQQDKTAASSPEEDWGSETAYRSRSYDKQRGPYVVKHQVQYYENHGEICITTTQLPVCQSHCTVMEYRIQATQVTCRPKLDQQFRSYRDQIKQGQGPVVTGVPKVKQFKVPAICNA